MIKAITLFLLYSTPLVMTQCFKNCNKNGVCNTVGNCLCFVGYTGSDCSLRTCPNGTLLADIPYNYDKAHQVAECSGRGECIRSTGLCSCNPGYSGLNCGKSECPNGCNGNGKCMSLRTAASQYDGYNLNHTTNYDLWDADLIYGCVCLPGWTGYDCSQRCVDIIIFICLSVVY